MGRCRVKIKKATLSLLLYLPVLLCVSGCVSMEWRGGMVPHFGLSPTKPIEIFENKEKGFREIDRVWPEFRGPNRLGIAPDQNIHIAWDRRPATKWIWPAGQGHSSLTCNQDLLFTLEQDGSKEFLVARRIESGQEAWRVGQPTKWEDMMSGTGPRSTPTLNRGHLYTLFSNGILAKVLPQSGKILWEKKVISNDYKFPEWGLSCSPLVWRNLVILNLGGNKSAVQAFDKDSGNLVWSSVLQGEGVYLSPSILKLHNEKHLLVAVKGKIAGLNPLTGETRWERKWKIFLNNAQIAQPLALTDKSILVAAGYGRGAECWSLNKEGEKYEIKTAWRSKNLKAKFSNPVIHNGFIYGLSENLLVCLKAENGDLQWRGKKYGYGRIILSGDKLLILGSTGVLSIVEANPQSFQEVQSFQLLSNARCWNGPALVGGYLFARNGEQVACFDFAR